MKPPVLAHGDWLYDWCCAGPVLQSLLGKAEGGVKPLECVGTPREVRQALAMARQRYATSPLITHDAPVGTSSLLIPHMDLGGSPGTPRLESTCRCCSGQ